MRPFRAPSAPGTAPSITPAAQERGASGSRRTWAEQGPPGSPYQLPLSVVPKHRTGSQATSSVNKGPFRTCQRHGQLRGAGLQARPPLGGDLSLAWLAAALSLKGGRWGARAFSRLLLLACTCLPGNEQLMRMHSAAPAQPPHRPPPAGRGSPGRRPPAGSTGWRRRRQPPGRGGVPHTRCAGPCRQRWVPREPALELQAGGGRG